MPTSLYALYPSKLQLVAIQRACLLPPDRVSLDGELLPPTESIKKKNSRKKKISCKKKIVIKEKWYRGYFLIDSGIKINFDLSENDGGDDFSVELYGNSRFPWEKDNSIWLGSSMDLQLLASRIIGWDIEEYEV